MIGFENDAPVIIFGMHRSGTTVIGDLLEAHGVFFGSQKDENGEALLFQALNSWMMTTSGASWDNPAATVNLLRDTESLELTDAYLRRVLSGPLRARYIGLGALLGRHAALRNGYRAWGWKDPRNTFTLPIWEQMYPDARFIYVERHGVDVAHSLVMRRARERRAYRAKFDQYPTVYGLRLKKGGFSDSMRSSTLENAFAIWEEYVAQGRAHAGRLGGDRVVSVTFEDLCTEPRETVGRLLAFLGLGDSESVEQNIIETLRPERGLAHRNNPDLVAFAETRAARLKVPKARSIYPHLQAAAN